MNISVVNRYKTNRNYGYFYSFIAFGLGFSGFQIILLLIAALGMGYESRTLTIPYRLFFLIASSLVIIRHFINGRYSKIGWLWFPLLTFWGLYFFRIVFDGYMNDIELSRPPIEYVEKAIGRTFIPMFMYLIFHNQSENKKGLRAFWMVHIICNIIAFYMYKDFLNTSYRNISSMAGEGASYMSAITLSYVGTVTLGLSLFFMLYKSLKINNKLYYLSSFPLFIIGTTTMLVGGTRSALVVSISIAGILLYKIKGKSSAIEKYAKQLFFLLLVAVAGGIIVISFGSTTIERFERIYNNEKGQGIEVDKIDRLFIFQNAIEQYLGNPILGCGLEEKNTMSYPHNHIIESFMATGLLGGISFVILSIVAIYRSIRLFNTYSELSWISVIFLIYFIRGLFSLSIIEPNLWYSMLLIFSIPLNEHGYVAK